MTTQGSRYDRPVRGRAPTKRVVPHGAVSPRISGLVLTRNEETNLPHVLASLAPWVDELVVVDMHSEDGTRAIAESFGARVVLHEPVGFADPARPFGVAQCRGDWVAMLDADELVPVPLARRLREVATEDTVDAVFVPRNDYMLGSLLSGTGWAHDEQLRFFRPSAVVFTQRIHAFIEPAPDARVLHLSRELAMTHFNYTDPEQFVEKLNRYTSIEADQAPDRRAGALRATWAGIREFGLRYVRLGGWRDGWRGYYLSVFMAFYRFLAVAKIDFARRTGGREAVELQYDEIRREILAGYENFEA